jgi:glycosyltransferase involved in cell wall biosynthesis
VDEMAAYAVQLLENEEMLQQFRANALEQAQKFDLDTILPDYERYYEKVIARSVNKVE